jgi:hypothetical protein
MLKNLIQSNLTPSRSSPTLSLSKERVKSNIDEEKKVKRA